jgi:uncharacterized membrane protein YhaH (DUF805 family)
LRNAPACEAGSGALAGLARAFSNSANFSGRANRGEYWWFVLANIIIGIVLSVIDSAVLGSAAGSASVSDLEPCGADPELALVPVGSTTLTGLVGGNSSPSFRLLVPSS